MTDYDIGYGKPPAANRFTKGRSGNPKGRPRSAQNLATIMQKALEERVTVTHNGRRRKISKLEAAITQMVNKAATGDQRALSQLLLQAESLEARRANHPAHTLDQDDLQVMQSFMSRLGRAKEVPDDA